MRSNPAAHPEPLKQRSLWHPSSRRPGGRERYMPMRPLRSFVFATWLLPLSAYAADKVCAPQSMIKAVTSIEAPDLPPNHFYRVPKTLYRLGERQGRVEEALNPETGVHLLIVVNEPDLWMVNLAERRGRYIRDPGPTFYFRARLFADAAVNSMFIRSLEIGCELSWLREAGIRPQGIAHPTLGSVNRIEFKEGKERLILYERANKPVRIELFGGNGLIMAMNYLSYEADLKAKPELFTKPEGIVFETEGGT